MNQLSEFKQLLQEQLYNFIVMKTDHQFNEMNFIWLIALQLRFWTMLVDSLPTISHLDNDKKVYVLRKYNKLSQRIQTIYRDIASDIVFIATTM